MKKIFFFAALCLANLVLAQENYELRTLTFEDADTKFAPYTLEYANKTIATWSDLVDDAQYNGTLTYAWDGTYTWCDANNTWLTHSFNPPYWGGGHAISNYTNPGYTNDDLPTGVWGWYEMQFATLNGGNNNSKNFCVHMGYLDFYNSGSGMNPDAKLQRISFADGVARVIDHMYITNICYVLNSLVFGDGFAQPANDTTRFEILAIGYDVNGNETAQSTFLLCNGKDNIIQDWTKWDLSTLGKVAYVEFNIVGSADLYGDYGLNIPAYFAYDDVAVRFDKDDNHTTSLPNNPTAQRTNSKFIIKNSQLLILKDSKTYTLMGQEIR